LFLTLGLGGATTLAEAHAEGGAAAARIRRAHPEIADVIVHTEP
jgi:divalent metal cation (Fe/Co/Zn/Cd) transporter